MSLTRAVIGRGPGPVTGGVLTGLAARYRPMRMRWLAASVGVLIVAATAQGAAAAPTSSAGPGWRAAQEISGTGALGSAVQGGAPLLSCPAAGHCLVAGTGSHKVHFVPFTARQAGSGWTPARAVPGITKLDGGTSAFLFAVSCGAAGDCVVGGDYIASRPVRHLLPFVAVERRGHWRLASELPGIAALHAAAAGLTAVSCSSAGDCLAGGWYEQAGAHVPLPFVVRMAGGRWRRPIELPGWATVTAGGIGVVSLVSCGSPGNCSASPGGRFVASLVNGRWHPVIRLPGTISGPDIGALSCARTGGCAAGGTYPVSQERYGAFAASGVDGVWGDARQVPGTSGADLAGVTSVFCAPARCVVGGYLQSGGVPEAFVVRQVGRTWSSATILPGIERLDSRAGSSLADLSCGTAGGCVAAGTYSISTRKLVQLVFVATEVRGTWRQAGELPGVAALATGHSATVTAVSCPAAGQCAVAGTIVLRRGGRRAFVAVQR